MHIEKHFEVPAPVPDVFRHLTDLPKVAPCFPRCRITEAVDATTWRGAVTVFLGPISYTFPGTLRMKSRDDEAHRVVLEGDATEQRGHGSARIGIVSRLAPHGEGTTVHIAVELELEGRVAQYGGAMIDDVASRLVQIFAENFRTNLLARRDDPDGAWVARKQIGGFRLMLWALARAFARLLGLGAPVVAPEV